MVLYKERQKIMKSIELKLAQVRMTYQLYFEIKKLAKQNQVSVSTQIRRILEDYVFAKP